MSTNWLCVSTSPQNSKHHQEPSTNIPHELRDRPSQSARNRKPRLQVLDHLGEYKLDFCLLLQFACLTNAVFAQAVICFSFIPITYLFYPETANRTLEDIDRFFETNPPIIICGNKLATQLSRPQIYADQDEEIYRQVEKHDESPSGVEMSEKGQADVGIEKRG